MLSSTIQNSVVATRRQSRGSDIYTSLFTLFALLLVTLVGCGKSVEPAAKPVTTDAPATAARGVAPFDVWDAVYLQGSHIGSIHTRLEPDPERNDASILDFEFRMSIARFGQETKQRVVSRSHETHSGQLLRFTLESQQGPIPTRVTGSVQGDKLQLLTQHDGREQRSELAWSSEYGGFHALEQSLRAKPLQSGEQRTIHALQPLVYLVARCELSAQKLETITLSGGPRELLRIDMRQHIPGSAPLDATLWCDASGEVLKQRNATAGQEFVRTTREQAEPRAGGVMFDLGQRSSVVIPRPPRDLHSAKRAVYRVIVKDAQIAELFRNSPAQQVRALDANSAEITVLAVHGNAAGPSPAPLDTPPTDADRAASTLIQSDDPRIVALAKQAAANDDQPWLVTTQLESLVRSKVANKTLSQTFASAVETLESGSGDCTEHAVLLAALCRARGLPARTAAGLVYVDQLPGFAFHMWTEVYVAGQWLGVDGTLGRGGLGAGHLKLAHTSLENPAALTALLPVIQVLGKLQIEVLTAE